MAQPEPAGSVLLLANSLSCQRDGRNTCHFYFGGRPLGDSFQVPTRLGTGRNPLEVYTKALHKKQEFSGPSHPQVRGPNTIFHVFIPELQN